MFTLQVYAAHQSAASLTNFAADPGKHWGPPNTGTLLSPLPLHQFIVNQGFLGKFGGIQQLYYFENDFLKGEKDTQ